MSGMLDNKHDVIVHLSLDEIELVDGGLNVWGAVRGVGTMAGGVVLIGAGVGIAGGSGGVAAVGGGVVAAFGGAAVFAGALQTYSALTE